MSYELGKVRPDLSIVVVAYNSEDFIADSLRALDSAVSDLQVIVIDNSADHASLAVVAEVTPDAMRIPSSSNLGFAKAVNQAAELAKADFIMLLNPDCVVSGEDIDSLLERIRKDPQIGIIAPTIQHPGGRLTVRSAGYEPTARHMFSQLVGFPRWRPTARVFHGFNLYPAGEERSETVVDWVSGACFITRRDLWRRTAGLSERWFMYAEDIEFCRRARKLGLKVVHSSLANAEHVVGASSETQDGPVWTLWIENLAEYYVQEFRPNKFSWLAWRLTACATFWTRAQIYGLKSRLSPERAGAWSREKEKFIAYSMAALKSTASG